MPHQLPSNPLLVLARLPMPMPQQHQTRFQKTRWALRRQKRGLKQKSRQTLRSPRRELIQHKTGQALHLPKRALTLTMRSVLHPRRQAQIRNRVLPKVLRATLMTDSM